MGKKIYTSINSFLIECDEDIDGITKGEICEILDQSYLHAVHPQVYHFLTRQSLGNDINEILESWQNIIAVDLMNHHRKCILSQEILTQLSHLGVMFILLKGFEVAQTHKYPQLRLMSDIDILIQHKDLDIVHDFLLTVGYTKIFSEDTAKDIGYRKENHFKIEVHFDLFNARDYKNCLWFLNDYWKFAKKFNDKPWYVTDENYTFVYITAHFTKHLLRDGIGFKALFDLASYFNHHKAALDFEIIEVLIQRLDNVVASNYVFSLCNSLYKTDIPVKINISNHILEGLMLLIGSFGDHGFSPENSMDRLFINEEKLSVTFVNFFLKKIFPTFKVMKHQYVLLRKWPFLLPVFYMVRLVDIFANRKGELSSLLAVKIDEARVETKLEVIRQLKAKI